MISDPSPGDYLGNVTFTVLDVETTGLSAASGHRICEVALLRLRGSKVLDSFESLVDPQRSISPGASAVNRLTDFHLNGQPLFSQVAERVQALLEGSVLVAHNAAFDLSFLAGEWRRLRWPPRLGFTVDTLLLAAACMPFATTTWPKWPARCACASTGSTAPWGTRGRRCASCKPCWPISTARVP